VATGFEYNIFAGPTSVSEFSLSFSTGPVAMAFDSRGRLFVATLSGKILILLDNNEDGSVDEVKTFASGVPSPLGLEFDANGDLFATSNIFAGAGRILRLPDRDGNDVADEMVTIVDGLPSHGDHQTNKLKFGPDGLLYFGQGSATDNGVADPGRPTDGPLNSTILRVDPDNPIVEVFASGLRNPFGIAFHPENGQLFSTDGGSGELCQLGTCPPEDLSPPEEVNWVIPGGHYGFPKCEGTPLPENIHCSGIRAPLTQFAPHLTPSSVLFYTGPQAGVDSNQMLVTLYKRISGQGGDLRRFTLTGDSTSGFHATEILPRLADFGIIDPGDGPLDTAIDPISGDIYVARFDPVFHRDPNEHHHFIYRIHRMGSDALPFIGPVSPSGVRIGSGPVSINIVGRHLVSGAVVLADGLQLPTRSGPTRFDLIADLSAAALATERTIRIEVQNPNGMRSNPQSLVVSDGPPPDPTDPAPQITSIKVLKKARKVIDPVIAGTKHKKLSLVVTGEDFDTGAQILVNGSPLELISASETELVGRFTKPMVRDPGVLTIGVQNASGKTSNNVTLLIVAAN
jgi:hypothetical protein